ncbi:MAG: FemAB family PEP-CTERM system-associated protein [Chloroflexota bacterium]
MDVGTRRVVEVDAQTDPRWLAFVSNHPHAWAYHHPAYLRVLEEAYGYTPVTLAVVDAHDRFLGVLPLTHTNKWLTGRGLTSLPRTLVAGPLSLDEETCVMLVRASVERVRRESGTRLQLRTYSAELDGLVDGVHCRPTQVTYVLDLPDDPEMLRFGDSRNHGAVKRAVSKSVKLGVNIRPAETESDLRAWYPLYLETMRWHGAPPRPYQFFQACWNILRPAGLMRLLLAEHHAGGSTKIVAGSIFLQHGRTVAYYVNGRRREDLVLRPNDAIHWRAIHDACAAGYRQYDFGGVLGENDGLARFKRKWGTTNRMVYYYSCPVPRLTWGMAGRTGGLNRARQSAEALVQSGVPRALWRRLPLEVTVVLGEWAHKWL